MDPSIAPTPARGERVPCRAPGCDETVRLHGDRLRRWREEGIAAYHSMACRVADLQAWVEGPCACGCGQTWRKYRSEIAKCTTGRVFVDAEHAYRRGGTKPRRGTEKPCEGCGVPMYVTAYTARARRFHSIECRRAHHERTAVYRDCLVCGVTFKVSPSQMEDKKYDTKRCASLARMTNAIPGQFHNGVPKRYDSYGYVLVYEPTHPAARAGGWMAEHRLVAEQMVGRLLTPLEEVDHINEVKSDNRPENLRVKSKSEHAAITAASIHARRRAAADELAEYRRMYGDLPVKGAGL